VKGEKTNDEQRRNKGQTMSEEHEDRLETKTEACREYARNFGEDHPERPWNLTDYDTWEPNPWYRGPRVPHPEY
jgi:hypothetical protein